jgi:recombinational DNA repair ATPase RecF
MLLDDVMSELDDERRELLSDLLRTTGQAVVATTDPDHVPGARDPDVRLVEVSGGIVRATGSTEVAA